MEKDNYTEILGIRMYSCDIPAMVADIIKHCESNAARENRCISATGAHGLITARKDPAFKQTLNRFYANLPDGMPGVWVGRLKGEKNMKRCYGPDFFAETMQATGSKNIKHFLCGGAEGVARQLQLACKTRFGNSNISGTFCPPFKKAEEYDYEHIAGLINEAGADIVWVGISTPKQEKFAEKLAVYTDVHFLATVGAAFDFHTGNLKQAPKWMQKAGLEWLFRLCVEPRRLYKRYIEVVPKFLIFSLADIVRFQRRKIFAKKK